MCVQIERGSKCGEEGEWSVMMRLANSVRTGSPKLEGGGGGWGKRE